MKQTNITSPNEKARFLRWKQFLKENTNYDPTKQLLGVYKTPKEKTLTFKYKALMAVSIDSEDFEKLNIMFKKDLEKLKLVCLLLFTTLTFAQSEIVVGSGSLDNGSFVIGGNIIYTPMLNDNKFTKPQPTPKPRRKYRKSEKQKQKEALRKLTIKTKKR